MTLLIVDDHASFRGFARSMLSEEGFEVTGEAEDGASALAEIARLSPDVVLLDVQLPDMDGFEVTRRLIEGGETARIVLTSSRDASDYGELLSSSAALGFIPKQELSGEALAALVN